MLYCIALIVCRTLTLVIAISVTFGSCSLPSFHSIINPHFILNRCLRSNSAQTAHFLLSYCIRHTNASRSQFPSETVTAQPHFKFCCAKGAAHSCFTFSRPRTASVRGLPLQFPSKLRLRSSILILLRKRGLRTPDSLSHAPEQQVFRGCLHTGNSSKASALPSSCQLCFSSKLSP